MVPQLQDPRFRGDDMRLRGDEPDKSVTFAPCEA